MYRPSPALIRTRHGSCQSVSFETAARYKSHCPQQTNEPTDLCPPFCLFSFYPAASSSVRAAAALLRDSLSGTKQYDGDRNLDCLGNRLPLPWRITSLWPDVFAIQNAFQDLNLSSHKVGVMPSLDSFILRSFSSALPLQSVFFFPPSLIPIRKESRSSSACQPSHGRPSPVTLLIRLSVTYTKSFKVTKC